MNTKSEVGQRVAESVGDAKKMRWEGLERELSSKKTFAENSDLAAGSITLPASPLQSTEVSSVLVLHCRVSATTPRLQCRSSEQ